jgi:hypothetical protein
MLAQPPESFPARDSAEPRVGRGHAAASQPAEERVRAAG